MKSIKKPHRIRTFFSLTLWTLLTVQASLSAQDQPERPLVVVIATGGTIASRSDAPQLNGAALVSAVPDLARFARIRVEEFSRIGSSQITPDHWLRLAKRVNQLFGGEEPPAGIIITHGTDTLDETAFFLNLTVRSSRPVVIVGSMRSADEISADGPANLLNAVRVAVDEQARGKGVLVVLNEDIGAARDIWKTDNRRVNTFRSPQLGFLGVVDPDAVVFYRSPLRPHTLQSEFRLDGVESLPEILPLQDYSGSDGKLIRLAASTHPAGVVMASFAGGRLSAGARTALAEVLKAGIPVVVASRVPEGRIVGNPLRGLEGAILARDLLPRKARILLMLALTKTRDPAVLQEIFDRY